MTNKEALEKIIFDYNFKEQIESGCIYYTEVPFMVAIAKIMDDLEVLEIIKKHKLLNYVIKNKKCANMYKLTDDEINKLKEWLESES